MRLSHYQIQSAHYLTRWPAEGVEKYMQDKIRGVGVQIVTDWLQIQENFREEVFVLQSFVGFVSKTDFVFSSSLKVFTHTM